MPTFSERIGVTRVRTLVQCDSIDENLRNSLWNACHLAVLHEVENISPYGGISDYVTNLLHLLWADFFKKPLDTIPHPAARADQRAYQQIRKYFFTAEWWGVYDFIEFLAGVDFPRRSTYITLCNRALEREMSAYRFLGKQLVRITDEQELDAIQASLDLGDFLAPVKLHIETAIKLFADRKEPDFRNSVKESISAVEAACQIITGDERATLAQALKRLEDRGLRVHEALKRAYSNLYGYTSDAEGIRHALLDESTLDFEDAKFMLASCAGFVSYLAAKAAKAGMKL